MVELKATCTLHEDAPLDIEVYVDSDWAGCKRTARSTSGGAVLWGRHMIKTWSSTQKTVALSSGEAELTAMVKMSCEVIGILQLMADLGVTGYAGNPMEGIIYADSSAALGVVKRKGNGKLRHVRVGKLWLQEKREREELEFRKVGGQMNPGDLMTKNLQERVMEHHMELIGQKRCDGRASSSLQV